MGAFSLRAMNTRQPQQQQRISAVQIIQKEKKNKNNISSPTPFQCAITHRCSQTEIGAMLSFSPLYLTVLNVILLLSTDFTDAQANVRETKIKSKLKKKPSQVLSHSFAEIVFITLKTLLSHSWQQLTGPTMKLISIAPWIRYWCHASLEAVDMSRCTIIW